MRMQKNFRNHTGILGNEKDVFAEFLAIQIRAEI